MNRFHGDLLLGGVRLRELDGEIEEDLCVDEELWSGKFRIGREQQSLVEVGRPYLLILDDGRSGRVEVTGIDGALGEDAAVVEFRPVPRPH